MTEVETIAVVLYKISELRDHRNGAIASTRMDKLCKRKAEED